MIIKLRTRDKLEDLLKKGKSESWIVAEGRENEFKKVEIYQFDGKRVIIADFDKSKSTRTEGGRLIVAFINGKLVDCNYKWNGQNPVKYESFPLFQQVKIGSQIWMAENLKVDKFLNGDLIPEAKTSEEWIKAGKEYKPAWCCYENKPENGLVFGKLYNWWAIRDVRNIAPEGWLIPKIEDWIELINYLGGEAIAGKKLKSKIGWPNNKNGTNDVNFNGLPGGSRDENGKFWDFFDRGMFWSITNNDNIFHDMLIGDHDKAFATPRENRKAGSGIYVRLIKVL